MISIIIPTYRSHDSLRQAIKSLQEQTCPDWEAVVCPDDGDDYTWLLSQDSRIRVVNSDQCQSGPGAARNRGLPHVQGSAVAYLDDDDQVSNQYVEQARAALETELAVIFPTVYVDLDGNTIRTIGGDLDCLDIEKFSQYLGSLHVVARTEHMRSWRNCFAEDVVHTCEIIDEAGGSINMIKQAHYIATVDPVSVSSTSTGIDREYEQLILDPYDTMSPQAAHDTRNLFEYRRTVNRQYESALHRIDYHTFVHSLV
jgi:glycosyltransferase involved in cell wall biosynthesis